MAMEKTQKNNTNSSSKVSKVGKMVLLLEKNERRNLEEMIEPILCPKWEVDLCVAKPIIH